MKKVIHYGLGAVLAGTLAFGTARAEQNAPEGNAGTATGSGAPNSVGQGDTGRHGDSPSTGSGASSSDTGMAGSTGSSDQAAGGGGATAGASGTAAGTTSAGRKVSKSLTDKLEKLHADNQSEIQMAQLASQNAQSPDVKQFAEQIQTDHQQLDQKLTDQAQTMGVSLEGKTFQKEQRSAQKEMKKLQSKTGSSFDKAYMSQMVKDHKTDAKEVKSAQKEAQKQHQTELASFLQQAETGINGHLHHAQQLEKTVKHERNTASTSSGSTSGTGSSSSSGTGSKVETTPGGNMGDTGGPSPTGKDRSSESSPNTPSGGAAGTSSDTGQRQGK